MPGATQEQNRPALQEARRLYFEGHSYQVIFQVTGLPKSQYLKNKMQWEKLKQRAVEKTVKGFVRDKSKEIQDILALSLSGLKEHVRKLVSRNEDMSHKDAKLLSDIVANIDRIGRLELGKPTDIKRYETMSPQELKEEAAKIMKDLELEDPIVDYKEPIRH